MARRSHRFLLLPRLLGLLCVCICAQAPLAGDAPAKVRLTLLGTTDIHGNIEPWDYYPDRPANRGLAKIATLVRRIRAANRHVFLLDPGDTTRARRWRITSPGKTRARRIPRSR